MKKLNGPETLRKLKYQNYKLVCASTMKKRKQKYSKKKRKKYQKLNSEEMFQNLWNTKFDDELDSHKIYFE